MRRRLFNLATAVSLMLLVASLAFWVRTRFACEQISYMRETSAGYREWMLGTIPSGLTINIHRGGYELGDAERRWREFRPSYALVRDGLGWRYQARGSGGGWRTWHGFHHSHEIWPPDSASSYRTRETRIALPFWFLASLSLPVPALVMIARLRRNQTSNAGLCPTCGYDLRATPGRCPECGHEMTP